MVSKEISERLVVTAVSLLLIYPAWVRGGTHSGCQWPMVLLAVCAWLVLLASLQPTSLLRSFAAPRRTPLRPSADGLRRASSGQLLRDPVVYLSILFLLLIGVQWWNAGRVVIFDYDSVNWVYSAPRILWLPSAVSPIEAREMLYWFFPALTLVLCVRHGLWSRASIRLVFGIMVVNAAVLGVFGIIQFLSGTSSIYWRFPLNGHFFASFGYSNHAAAYFTLLLSLSLGLCFYLKHSWNKSHHSRGTARRAPTINF